MMLYAPLVCEVVDFWGLSDHTQGGASAALVLGAFITPLSTNPNPCAVGEPQLLRTQVMQS